MELIARLAGGDLRDVDEHDGASRALIIDRVRQGVVAERGPAQEPPGPAEAGDPRALGVVVESDEHDAADIPERALTLPVGIAREAAGALAAPNHAAGERSDWGILAERPRVPAQALVGPRAQRQERLAKALAVLAPSPARLEHARVLVDLGATLRAAGQRTAAREPVLKGSRWPPAAAPEPWSAERAPSSRRSASGPAGSSTPGRTR